MPFTGGSVALHFYLGDLELDGPDALGDELRVYLHRGDIVFIGRLTDRISRVIVAAHDAENGTVQDAIAQRRQVTIADFQETIDRAGIKLKVLSADWMTPFGVNDRQAEKMQIGNVFLAGDASHIHSPVGGQGMNTGIQDAANLAWKIGAVRAGASPELLSSYEEERRPVGKPLLQRTSAVLAAGTASNPLLEKVRDFVCRPPRSYRRCRISSSVSFPRLKSATGVLPRCWTAAVVGRSERATEFRILN